MGIKVFFSLMLLHCTIITPLLYGLDLEPLFDDPTLFTKPEEEVIASDASCATTTKLSRREKNTLSSRGTGIRNKVFIDMAMLYFDKTREEFLTNMPIDDTESDAAQTQRLSRREANNVSGKKTRKRNNLIKKYVLDQFKKLPKSEQNEINNIVGEIAQHEIEEYLKRQQSKRQQI